MLPLRVHYRNAMAGQGQRAMIRYKAEGAAMHSNDESDKQHGARQRGGRPACYVVTR